jgi:hypothetical protein
VPFSRSVATPQQITLHGCNGGLADLLVATRDSNLATLDFIYQPQVTVGTSSSGAGTPVAVTGTYAAMPNVTELVADAPASTQAYEAGVTIFTSLGTVYGNAFGPAGGGDGASLPVQTPVVSGGTTITTFDVTSGGDVFDSQSFEEWGPGPATTVTLDYGMTQLVDFTSAPSFDVASQSFQWTLGVTGKAPDAVSGTVQVQRSLAGGSAMQWQWNIVAPGDENGALALPTLPTDLFDFSIHAGDTATVATAGIVAAPGGYDAFRAMWYSAFYAFGPITTSNPSGAIVTAHYFNDADDVGGRER